MDLVDGPCCPIKMDLAMVRARKMIIELAVFIAVAVVMATAVVKIFEWRQEALYGPYARRDRGKQNSQAID